jgi:hypothetical protein
MSSKSITVFTNCYLVVASNDRRCPSSGIPNGPRPQLPVSNSDSSPQLNPNSLLTDS